MVADADAAQGFRGEVGNSFAGIGAQERIPAQGPAAVLHS